MRWWYYVHTRMSTHFHITDFPHSAATDLWPFLIPYPWVTWAWSQPMTGYNIICDDIESFRLILLFADRIDKATNSASHQSSIYVVFNPTAKMVYVIFRSKDNWSCRYTLRLMISAKCFRLIVMYIFMYKSALYGICFLSGVAGFLGNYHTGAKEQQRLFGGKSLPESVIQWVC